MSVAKAPTNKPRMSSEERRAAIIQAALRLFAEKGFRGTTTRELAAAVGVTEPVLYEHFRTKRDLYSAIIEEKANTSLAELHAVMAQFAESGDDYGFFNRLGAGIVDWYVQDPTFFRLLLFSSLEGHELKELFHERTAEFFSIVSGYIERRIGAGAMKAVDAEIAGRTFFGMVAHYAQTGLVFGCSPFEKDPKQVVYEMVNIFMQGMSASEGKQ
jgi:AcrR family transcriptional regulator